MAVTQADDARIVPFFKTIAVPNEVLSRENGRPMFDDMEVVEIRFGGDRNKISVFPAHAFSQNVELPDGTTQPMTYAQRFAPQYAAYKQRKTQVKEGTPVEELPFLTQAKRSELKALNIHTAETLAALDGSALKTLGMGGRELKNQAIAYIEAASGTADVTRLAAENEALRAQLADMQAQNTTLRQPLDGDWDGKPGGSLPKSQGKSTVDPLDKMTDAELKDLIKTKTGATPRGNPSRETLLSMAAEASAE